MLKQNRSSLAAILSLLGWPLILGVVLTVGFYGVLNVLNSAFLNRYFAGHPVEYVETCLFFVAAVAIGIRLVIVLRQFGAFNALSFQTPPVGGQKLSEIPTMLAQIRELPATVTNSYYVRRVHSALDYVHRTTNPQGVDNELKHLAELDADQQHDGYAFVRTIIWATPMLGFLGTVIGITLALGDLSPEALVNTPEVAMQGLLGGLSVAFDTTALALSLSMILMFAMFMSNQIETQLLTSIDNRVRRDLIGRFEVIQIDDDPNVAKIRQMTERVVQSSETLVQRQVDLWHSALQDVREGWSQAFDSAAQRLDTRLPEALDKTTRSHSDRLMQHEQAVLDRTQHLWSQLQTTMTSNATILKQQQLELARQGETLAASVTLLSRILDTKTAAPASPKPRIHRDSQTPTRRAA